MFEDLNGILAYLETNRGCGFERRTKFLLRIEVIRQRASLDKYLARLSKDGYVRLYLHPDIGIHDNLSIEPDLKIFCSLSTSGHRFIQSGGYQRQAG